MNLGYAGLLRCGKSCRLRWINYLRADLKRGNISEEEEEMIIKLHATLGNRCASIRHSARLPQLLGICVQTRSCAFFIIPAFEGIW